MGTCLCRAACEIRCDALDVMIFSLLLSLLGFFSYHFESHRLAFRFLLLLFFLGVKIIRL